jgi:NitT/TauT family transport system ATP-binding protein
MSSGEVARFPEQRPVILKVDGVGVVYGQGTPTPKEAIKDLSFEVREHELVCVVGPSGAGKTTLLRCIGGLLQPSRGAVYFEGAQIRETPADVAVVFQDYSRSLFPWLTVAGNIVLPLPGGRRGRTQREEAVRRVLAAVGLSDVAERHPWQLSGGMQQRIAIARALAYQPRLLLMDEPFASVDAQTRFELEDLMLQLQAEFGMTIVFVTHDIDEAVYLGTRVIVLSKSPCVVERELDVTLPSPRNQEATRSAPDFVTLRTEILRLVTRKQSTAVTRDEGADN